MIDFNWDPRRWGYLEYVSITLGPGVLVFIFLMLNFYGVKPVNVKAKITEKEDVWTIKYGARCVIRIGTELGDVSKIYDGKCKNQLYTGERITLNVAVGRITRGLLAVGAIKSLDN